MPSRTSTRRKPPSSNPKTKRGHQLHCCPSCDAILEGSSARVVNFHRVCADCFFHNPRSLTTRMLDACHRNSTPTDWIKIGNIFVYCPKR